MAKQKVKDGWHTITTGGKDYDIRVEDGIAIRAVKIDRNGSRISAGIYRGSGKGHLVNVNRQVTLGTVRRGLKEGRYRIE